MYTDAKLGFQLIIPRNWQAQPQPGSQASPNNAAVTFTVDEQSSHALILLGVFHGSMMPAAFAGRGTSTTHIGPYPAFVADRSLREARAPCLVRIFLAGVDYVLADWCAPNAFAYQAQFEQVLATYQPASLVFVPRVGASAAPAAHTCAGMQQLLGYAPLQWGRQLATPVSTGWKQVGSGAFICSNEGSADWYLFQCTELVNRLLYERWALPHLPGNAARYYDYYQDGILHPGTIRTFPSGSYQLSDDASQGKSAFRPVAGDLLIFQDVNHTQVGWTSGLTNSPGHVAVIVGVDDVSVYVAQENYSDTQYFLALPIHKVANGYEITDLSGWSQRIVRGWIHFTVNGAPSS
ncbi:MAG TPA: CHAP domain-containing protein [Ktedonobacteraceae bacterium]